MKTPSNIDSHLYATLFPRVPSRAEKSQLQILEGVIECYGTIGIDNTTYEKIASKCKLSRSLVMHYFPDREGLTETTFKYIRATMQKLAVDAIGTETLPEKQFTAYIRSVFDWTKRYNNHAKAWVLYFYYCTLHSQHRKVHTELTLMGRKRIETMIIAIRKKPLKAEDLAQRAKSIQFYLTGAVLGLASEDLEYTLEQVADMTVKECLDIIHR